MNRNPGGGEEAYPVAQEPGEQGEAARASETLLRIHEDESGMTIVVVRPAGGTLSAEQRQRLVSALDLELVPGDEEADEQEAAADQTAEQAPRHSYLLGLLGRVGIGGTVQPELDAAPERVKPRRRGRTLPERRALLRTICGLLTGEERSLDDLIRQLPHSTQKVALPVFLDETIPDDAEAIREVLHLRPGTDLGGKADAIIAWAHRTYPGVVTEELIEPRGKLHPVRQERTDFAAGVISGIMKRAGILSPYVQAELGWSHSKLSRLLNGHNHPSKQDFAALIHLVNSELMKQPAATLESLGLRPLTYTEAVQLVAAYEQELSGTIEPSTVDENDD